MTCNVDIKIDEIYPSCCIDYGKPEDCSFTKSIQSKHQCKHWVDDEFPFGFIEWWNTAYGSEYPHKGIALAAWNKAIKVCANTTAT